MVLELLDEAVAAGARQKNAMEIMGLDVRTVQRWRKQPGEDRRKGRRSAPANKLSDRERQEVLRVATSVEFRELPPGQIVPRLADRGVYLASESTFHRVLRQQKLMTHRQRSRPVRYARPKAYLATGPEQLWAWDITYLPAEVRGQFFYLYLVEDVWSRLIVGSEVHERECMELSSQMIGQACARRGIRRGQLVLHSDNGGPMRGETMVTTLKRLGVVPSFSRPGCSDDNAYCESLFRTMKYRPAYPDGRFDSLQDAREWVDRFVAWYNTEHFHSGIGFVTPMDRHTGRDVQILEQRRRTYASARQRLPQRWTGPVRAWGRTDLVWLNRRDSDLPAVEAA